MQGKKQECGQNAWRGEKCLVSFKGHTHTYRQEPQVNVCCPVEIRQELSMLPFFLPSLKCTFSLLFAFISVLSLCISACLLYFFSFDKSFQKCVFITFLLCVVSSPHALSLSVFLCLPVVTAGLPTHISPWLSWAAAPCPLISKEFRGVCVCACVHYTAVYEQNGHFDVRRLFKTKEIILQSS